MTAPTAARAALIALVLTAASACGGGGGRPRNAVLITLDTTRYDAPEFNRFDNLDREAGGVTPHLDALAARSLVYDRARTVAPQTLPAHASILTGLTPVRHTVRVNGTVGLPENAVTVAERARERGFQTAAFVAALVVGKGTGLEQGFDVYDQPAGGGASGSPSWERPAAAVASRAAAWLRDRDPDRPFLLWAHFFDPHLPYLAPREFQAPGRPGYLAEVAAMDAGVGAILDALRAEGLMEETLIVVVADHGEGLKEHDERTHGTLVYDSTIHVPFLVHHPDGWRAGERSDEIVGLVDVAPTLHEALGLGASPDSDGHSLFRRAVPEGRGVYFESYYGFVSFGWAPLAGWADGRGKYVHGAAPELYAPGDRAERENLAPERPAEVARYRESIAALAARPVLERHDEDTGEAGTAHLDALGYAGGHAAVRSTDVPDPLADTGLPSPVAMNDLHNRYLDAKALQTLGRLDEAIPAFEELLREDPGNNAAWFQLGLAHRDRGAWSEARDAFGRAIATGGDGHPARSNLGFALEMLGDPPGALEQYRRAVEHAPHDFDLLQQVVRLLHDTGAPPAELARYNAMLVEAAERSRAR